MTAQRAARKQQSEPASLHVPYGMREVVAGLLSIGILGLLIDLKSDVAVIKSQEGSRAETRRIADSALRLVTSDAWRVRLLRQDQDVTKEAIANIENALFPNDYRRHTNYEKRRRELFHDPATDN